MARNAAAQLNIRSDYARERVKEIARRTGMSATEIIEDALRGYVLPAEPEVPPGLIRRGGLLIHPGMPGRVITQEETEAAIEATRLREP